MMTEFSPLSVNMDQLVIRNSNSILLIFGDFNHHHSSRLVVGVSALQFHGNDMIWEINNLQITGYSPSFFLELVMANCPVSWPISCQSIFLCGCCWKATSTLHNLENYEGLLAGDSHWPTLKRNGIPSLLYAILIPPRKTSTKADSLYCSSLSHPFCGYPLHPLSSDTLNAVAKQLPTNRLPSQHGR